MMRRTLVAIAVLALLLAAAARGAEDAPWKRVLKGDNAKKAAEQEKKLAELQEAGQFAKALKMAEALAELRAKVQGADHWEAVNARWRGTALRRVVAQGEETWKEYASTFALAREAAALESKGRYKDAQPLKEKHLTIHCKVLGEEHPDTALSYNNVAANLYAQGKYKEAEEGFRKALAIRRKVLGEVHPDTATSHNNLAANHNDQGKYKEAEEGYRKALAIKRKVLGEQHPDTATSYNNVASNLHEQGKYVEAEPLFRQALALVRQAYGEQHLRTAISLNNLATNLTGQSKYIEAEPLFRQSLAILRKTVGEQHPSIATSLDNLATNLSEQGKYVEAEPLHRQSLAILRKTVGEQHPSIATSLKNLASTLQGQGKCAQAERLSRQALDISRATVGEDHNVTAASLYCLAEILRHQNKYAEAEPLYRQALAICRKRDGELKAFTAICLNDLANNLTHQGKYAEAEMLLRQALAIQRMIAGEQKPSTAAMSVNLAFNLDLQGKYAEAETLFRQGLSIFRRRMGEQHSYTVRFLNGLASNLSAQGKYSEGADFQRAAVQAFEMARLHAAASGFDRAIFGGQEHVDPHPAAAGCMARLKKPIDAWRYAEAGLGRGLLDDLTASTQLLLTPDEQQTLRARLTRLAQLNRLLVPLLSAEKLKDAEIDRRNQLVKERDDLQTELARIAAEHSHREVWSLESIHKQIPADAALVFWTDVKGAAKAADPNGEHWGCIVRQRGEPVWVHLPGSGDKDAWTPADDQLPRRLRDDLASGETSWQQRARQLARQRLMPLEPHLKARDGLPAVRRLIAVPAGRMAGIPLEVLSDDYVISYAPSGTIFARLRGQHRPIGEPSLLALGDPNFNLPPDKPALLPEHGLLLTLVLPGGTAAKAGLRSGDVLLAYNGQQLHAFADLKPKTSGKAVPVQIWRDGKTFATRLSPGKLGVAMDRAPAPEALRRQREFNALLASRSRDKIASLPASRYEVKALATLFPKATVLLGSQASEQKLDALAAADQLKDYCVLHLATHGEVNMASALQSALLLARDKLPDANEQARLGRKIYDGRLRVATIAATWQLDADLVTLSACQTALGPQGGGEGLLGFSQVLFRKGARSLLVSLWKVDDTATALLMTRFYENWLGRRKGLKKALPKATALREAKQWLRTLRRQERDRLAANLAAGKLRGTIVDAKPVIESPKEAADTPYAHPRYWAAFILIGDPD